MADHTHYTKITIITICKNSIRTIERTINSILSQNYPSLEYIIIDGGSTDGTDELIRDSYLCRLAHYSSQIDDGISDAFNRGISHATGEIIGIINSDDWLEPNILYQLHNIFARGDNADIYCTRVQLWDGDRPGAMIGTDTERFVVLGSLAHPGVFVRRRVYQQIGLFRLDMRYAMDYELLLRAQRYRQNFCTVDIHSVNMQAGGASDKHWFAAKCEAATARHIHGTRLFYNILITALQLTKSLLRQTLCTLGLNRLSVLYHKLLRSLSSS